MLMKVFSIYDSKAEAYLRPFYDITRGSAIRAVSEAVNDKTTSFAKYPGDFCLFELGEFDDSCAGFNLHLSPISLGVLIEYVSAEGSLQ
jgi:hypothetical protein